MKEVSAIERTVLLPMLSVIFTVSAVSSLEELKEKFPLSPAVRLILRLLRRLIDDKNGLSLLT
jgi:hypothetical protein